MEGQESPDMDPRDLRSPEATPSPLPAQITPYSPVGPRTTGWAQALPRQHSQQARKVIGRPGARLGGCDPGECPVFQMSSPLMFRVPWPPEYSRGAVLHLLPEQHL